MRAQERQGQNRHRPGHLPCRAPWQEEWPSRAAKIYELWVDEVNKAGGIYVKEYGKKLPVELKRYDDKSDIGTMTNLLEKLIVEDKVDFIFPPWGTAWLFAPPPPSANKYGYILIGGPGGALKLKELSLPYFFQVLNFSETQAPALAKTSSRKSASSPWPWFTAATCTALSTARPWSPSSRSRGSRSR